MYASEAHIRYALDRLRNVHPFFGMSFLAFKRFGLPVGRPVNVIFMNMAEDLLKEFYKPSVLYDGFYNPFKTSNPKQRWVKPRYPSTSLQRITADTFGRAFIHKKDSSKWGWHPDYIERLARKLGKHKIPALQMATWLFRDMPVPSTNSAEWLVDHFVESFGLLPEETERLFDLSTAEALEAPFSERPCTEQQILGIIGAPPGHVKNRGLVLASLVIADVGPSKTLSYSPSDRLNIITGDNSLGKTFLLDCLWWALTDDWTAGVAIPPVGKGRRPRIEADLSSKSNDGRLQVRGKYSAERSQWTRSGSEGDSGVPLTVYARYDGSFFVWNSILESSSDFGWNQRAIHLSRDEVWGGKRVSQGDGRERWICNGLVHDWASWQTKGRAQHNSEYENLVAALHRLSPSEDEPLSPGDLMRIPRDSREMPSLIMPYGQVPIVHASAGVRRILAIAYLLVWAWKEHAIASKLSNRRADDRMIVLIDEIEAHLHPRWQRSITPAIMEVVSQLSPEISPQVHLATHSPMVLASAESIFNYETDSLHHLEYRDQEVMLESIQFVRHGNVDSWLISSSFGLRHARSIAGERAIENAKAIQSSTEARESDVQMVHKQLQRSLSEDDEFWPRWLYFAKSHGVQI